MLIRFIWIVSVVAASVAYATASPLHQAVRSRDIVTLEALLESHTGDALNATEAEGITPLHLAAATDQADCAKLLLSRGAKVDAVNSKGFTPLHWAASRDATYTINVLLEAGADINAKAQNNITPLHWAASREAVNAIRALLDAGADFTALTTMGYTPLHLAVKKNPYSEGAVLLAETQAISEDKATENAALQQSRDVPVKEPPPPLDAEELADAPVPAPRAQPGMFLAVPIGLGDALNFVWIPESGSWFGKHEITNARYRRFNPEHSSRRTEGLTLDDPEQPAVYVSWQDAMDYCAWLNTHFADRIPLGYTFRLPTEAEWMIAASAGGVRTYPWGDQWPPVYGNFSDHTAKEALSQWRGITGYEDGYAVTAPVESSGMNELGVFGIAGNVWEWTMDWQDPVTQVHKIRKGGSWDFDEQESLRIDARGVDRPQARYDTIGFRVVVGPAISEPAISGK